MEAARTGAALAHRDLRLSELYEKENGDPETSGYGFELTFRLACDPTEEEPPSWALNFLQNLARYVFETGNVFRDGDWMPINGPISRDRPTLLRSIAIATDPELPLTRTPFGAVAFLQMVGITEDEERAAKLWRTSRLLDTFRPRLPLLLTDLDRASMLDDPVIRQAVEEGSAREGSSTGGLWHTSVFGRVECGLERLELGRPAAGPFNRMGMASSGGSGRSCVG